MRIIQSLRNLGHCFSNIRQLLDEIEHDSENYQARSLRYLPKPKTEADNTNQGLNNSRYHAKTEFNNCFIILLHNYTIIQLYNYTIIQL